MDELQALEAQLASADPASPEFEALLDAWKAWVEQTLETEIAWPGEIEHPDAA